MDKVIRARLFRGIVHHIHDFLFSFVLKIQSVGDVFADCAREQDRFLLNDSDLVVVPLRVKLLNIATIEEYLALFGVIEALNE